MREMRLLLPLTSLALALAACTTSFEGNRADPPDAAITVPPDAPDATPVVVADAEPDAEPEVQPCVEGDIQLTNPDDGTCYMLLNALTDWTGAQAACLALGANLVSIETAEEQLLVAGLAVQYPVDQPDLWIGASDTVVEGSFVWVDQAALVYDNWRLNEPNNGGIDGEDCAIIEGDALLEWDDRSCAVLHPAICER